jgi:predicted alpha/beta hydrolase
MALPIQVTSIPVPLAGGALLNLERFTGAEPGPPLLLLHGAIENGRIFYSASGKGLAPYLAKNGFDVFVADLRGRGKSRPPIGRGACFGQTEAITEDIPAFINAVRKIRGDIPQQWLAHSWGGVLFSSFLARFPEYAPTVSSLVYFGSKRTIRVWNIWRIVKVELVWKWLCPLACRLFGYLPARQMHIGSDSETIRSYQQSATWVKNDAWIDADGFDYGTAIQKRSLPPIWYLAAANDHALGHPDDVRDFMASAGEQECRYTILSRANGNRHDYDHITMLTHPDSAQDHFPKVLEWLNQHCSETVKGKTI